MYINKVIKVLKSIFYIVAFFLIIISLYPGSLLGYFFYGDTSKQPNFIPNPYGTTINHFISYLFVSLLGLISYMNSKDYRKIIYTLFFLCIILEIFHLIIPNRSFQLSDLIGNILGVTVAYCLLKIYLLFNKT